jgi:ATP/maltotriose-dependent transcriptional regulator MalT
VPVSDADICRCCVHLSGNLVCSAVDWLRSDGRPHAWLTLDEGDNDTGCLAANLVAAIRLGVPALESTLPSLEEAEATEPRLLVIELLDALRNLAHDLVLVLDDCQALTASGVWEIVSSLIDYAPQQLRLVLATRAVPPLPLHRLRARGQLTELGAEDLRFEPEEASAFLRQTLGLDLGAESERELSDITEGWPVGLQSGWLTESKSTASSTKMATMANSIAQPRPPWALAVWREPSAPARG